MTIPRRPFPSSFWMLSLIFFLLLPQQPLQVDACSDLLVTPGASVDGSALLAYNADSPVLFGTVYHYPATSNSMTTTRETEEDATTTNNKNNEKMTQSIYDWDSGVYLGEIEQVEKTWNVIGNTNERGLVIGESTFGGVAPLAWNQTGAIMDYGSLIYITLQRAETAVEAMDVMTDLVNRYGYASGGESFSIADATGAVWMMELIGTGSDYPPRPLGAVYVAVRIPDGAVAAHANQARIQTFSRDDPDQVRYASDVIDVAIHYGLYQYSEDDPEGLDFSFSDTYHPVTFLGARQGDARVWSLFSQLADTNGTFQAKYESYATGHDLAPHHRMPLYIVPHRKLSLQDVAQFFASHYEDTVLDSRQDVGAGLFATPYRPRPLVWQFNDDGNNGQRYHNERSVATAKSGWSIIMQTRPWLPPPLTSILWFAADDSSTAPRVPIYSASTQVHEAYAGAGAQDGVVTPLLQWDLNKAFWIQNMVSNWAYFRWADVSPLLTSTLTAVQTRMQDAVTVTDQHALDVYRTQGPAAAQAYVTQQSMAWCGALQVEWTALYGRLFAQFRDFYTILPDPQEPVCHCQAQEPGMSQAVKQRIVTETGNRYKVFDDYHHHDDDDDKRESVSCRDRLEHACVYQGESGPPHRVTEYARKTATAIESPCKAATA